MKFHQVFFNLCIVFNNFYLDDDDSNLWSLFELWWWWSSSSWSFVMYEHMVYEIHTHPLNSSSNGILVHFFCWLVVGVFYFHIYHHNYNEHWHFHILYMRCIFFGLKSSSLSNVHWYDPCRWTKIFSIFLMMIHYCFFSKTKKNWTKKKKLKKNQKLKKKQNFHLFTPYFFFSLHFFCFVHPIDIINDGYHLSFNIIYIPSV